MNQDITDRKKADEELRESEKRFRGMAERSSDLVFILDKSMSPTYVSPSSLTVTGYDPEELVGKSPEFARNTIFSQSGPELMEAVRATMNGVSSDDVEIELTKKDGTPVYVSVHAVPVMYDGTFEGAQVTMRDITRRRKAEEELLQINEELNASNEQLTATEEELRSLVDTLARQEQALRESEEKFRSIVETSPDMIWEIDQRGKFRYVSPRVHAIMGYTPEETIGRSITDLVPEEVKPVAIQELGRLFSEGGSLAPFEMPARHRDGHTLVLEIRPALTGTNGKREGFRGVAVDITERKRAEDALRRANRQLNLLTGITRHDILNKVSVVLGFLRIAGMKFRDPALAGYLERMVSATTEIQSQIEFTKVYENLGTHEPQWIDIDSVIPRAQVPSTVTLRASVQGISVFADPMLEKVFFNLMDNSIRHGERVTKVNISACRSGEDLVVVWEDNGTGIAAEEKEQIFERGFGKNTGLGMFLAREILSLTGIRITENGTQGEGARFGMTVPKGMWRSAGNMKGEEGYHNR